MKATKELLILVMPLMAAGCGGSGFFNPPPPPPTNVDPEGIYEGNVANGDLMIGIVTADGTADFIEFASDTSLPPNVTSAAVLVPDAIVPDSNDAFSGSFASYSVNNFTLPNSDTFGTTLSGLVTPGSGLAGQYAVTGNDTSILFDTSFDSANYVLSSPVSTTDIAGTYVANFYFGTVSDQATMRIVAGNSATSASVDVTESNFGCHYTGTLSIPDQNYNAYKISFSSADSSQCADQNGLLDNMTGLGALFNTGSEMFVIMSDANAGVGMFMTLVKQ